MNKKDANITFSSYFNDITIHFYEDTDFMESVGKRFGRSIWTEKECKRAFDGNSSY